MRKISLVEVEDQEDDGFDDQLEHDSRFLQRIEASRQEIAEGRGVRLEDVEYE
ncbi:MAG TPA: hypothetical protein VLT87_11455 [Thermoanaerobaculia bacterium]|nr:hypothetical protein [Thermoanaerobaculia bacterium]